MLLFDITEDGKWIRLVESNDELEEKQVEISFTRKVSNWHFKKKKFGNHWDGTIKFFKKVGGYHWIPVGLWNQLFEMGKEHGIDVRIKGLEAIIDNDIDKASFTEYISTIYSDPEKPARDYQIEAAFNILKHRYTLSEIGTSGGKTLIAYMVLSWLLEIGKINKFLMIVPKEGLIIQGEEDFEEYGIHSLKVPVKIGKVFGGAKKGSEGCNVVIGTFHSLVKKEEDYLSQFDAVFIDEAHQTNTMSIKNILSKMPNTKYRFGMTGTLPNKKSADHFTIEAFIGPIVNFISPKFLSDEGYTTPVSIKIVRMDYLNEDIKEKLSRLKEQREDLDGTAIYNVERKLVIDNEMRLNFICNFIGKTSKNSLVLFQSVTEGYGKRIYDRIREQHSDREVFIVDGSTDYDSRDIYKKKMEEGNNKILIATFGTFSTGISINNLHNIFLVESYKSEILIKQSLGRGMRLADDKDQVNIIDFVDDFTYDGKKNYLIKHSDERIKIYKREKFDYKIYSIDLSKAA
jgi:superfamily II DNA or RNA helicase